MASASIELVVLDGSRAGAVLALPDVPAVLGRSPEAHFQVDDPWISSLHALFERRGDTFWVVDLDSRNGTFAGEARVREAALADGLTLRFGRTSARVRAAAPEEPAPTPAPTPDTPAATPAPYTRSFTLPGVRVPGGPLVAAADPGPVPLAALPAALLRVTLHVPAGAAPSIAGVQDALATVARAIAERAGLTVRLPGGALALFGLGGLSPQEPRLALAAARAARAAVAALPSGVRLRAAVDLGPVLAGNVGEAGGYELAALGEAAERVERLLALAGPDEIAVGADAIAAAGAEGAAPAELGLEPAQAVELGGEPLRVAFDRG